MHVKRLDQLLAHSKCSEDGSHCENVHTLPHFNLVEQLGTPSSSRSSHSSLSFTIS